MRGCTLSPAIVLTLSQAPARVADEATSTSVRSYEGSLRPSRNVELSGGGSEVPRIQEATMFYVGLDIHSKRISLCVLSATGQVLRRAQVRTVDEMMRILEGLPDRFEVWRPVAAMATTTTCSARSPLGSPWRIRGVCG
jgi:hypothetical protein